jgi:hypothetical protein
MPAILLLQSSLEIQIVSWLRVAGKIINVNINWRGLDAIITLFTIGRHGAKSTCNRLRFQMRFVALEFAYVHGGMGYSS